MIQPFNYSLLAATLYAAMIVFSAIYIAVKHEDLSAPLVIILAVLWPIYYVTAGLILILQEHDDKSKLRKIKKQNFFDTTQEGKAFLQRTYSKDDIKRIRKGSAPKSKKIHV